MWKKEGNADDDERNEGRMTSLTVEIQENGEKGRK